MADKLLMSADLTETAPRLVITAGLHGSASTWVFNVIRELMIARYGRDRVRSLYADTAEQLIGRPELSGRCVVWKTHQGGRGWDGLVWLSRPIVVVSLRDPRDAICSMMSRFRMGFEPALLAIGDDCAFAMHCAEQSSLVLRYEDRFFEKPGTVRDLARLTGSAVDDDSLDRIFRTYRTEAVRNFAASLESLPRWRFSNGPSPLDRVTQIHRTHIGDGRTGKWRQLDAAMQDRLTAPFAPFLERFRYPV